MTIYMSCFSCSKVIKMVEDPIEKANSILQDLSGIVLDVDAKIHKEVIQDLSGIVVQLEVAAATISDIVEKGSSEIEELKE